MAKIKHPSFVNVLNESINYGVKQNTLHLHTESIQDGRKVQINGQTFTNFATSSYLGLAYHPSVCQRAIDAIKKEGLHVTASRTYISSALYQTLEDLLGQIFGAPTLVANTTTLVHLATIPVLFKSDDLVILDQQVHASVKQAVNMVVVKGTSTVTIRHNNLEMLERMIQKHENKHRRIWYALDGIYSMYGDFPDLEKLVQLLEKYPNLWLYVDDAHGQSWAGKHGRGYVLSQIELHKRMILTTSLKKGFGAEGGVAVFPNQEDYNLVKNCGGTIIFTNALSSAALGAAIGSAKIHLSDEIYTLQNQLRTNIDYCNQLMVEANLPIVAINHSPIFFMAVGLEKATFNLQRKLLNDGMLVNASSFPIVPLKCGGIRFSICSYHTKENIRLLVDSFKRHYPVVMAEENFTMEALAKGFRMPRLKELNMKPSVLDALQNEVKWNVSYSTTIRDMDMQTWNQLLGANGSFDVNGLRFLEDTFQGNDLPENNWKFHYFIIKDELGTPVIATFFTEAIVKDDMLSPASISEQIEEERLSNTYYMTSPTFMMGSPLTEGEHLYINQENENWTLAFEVLLKRVWEKQEACGATQVMFRDCSPNQALHDLLQDKGFVKIDLPNTNIIEFKEREALQDFESYVNSLSSRKRYRIRRNVYDYEAFFQTKPIEKVNAEELQHIYELYLNVKNRNLGLNLFALPIEFFNNAILSPHWQVQGVYFLNDENEKTPSLQGIIVNYCSSEQSLTCPLIIGFNYDLLHSHSIYRQILYQAVKFAWDQEKDMIYLGLSADIEKRKFGAIAYPKEAYVYTKDNFSFEVLNNMAVVHKK